MNAALPAIALDVGDARIGFAASDNAGRFVFGRQYHTRQGDHDALAVLRFAQSEQAHTIVVGLPLHRDGSDSPQTQKVREFVATLEQTLHQENWAAQIVLQDERFTTRIATQRLATRNKRARQEKGNTDEASAVAILETWLDKTRAAR